jgi:hypothetical protein
MRCHALECCVCRQSPCLVCRQSPCLVCRSVAVLSLPFSRRACICRASVAVLQSPCLVCRSVAVLQSLSAVTLDSTLSARRRILSPSAVILPPTHRPRQRVTCIVNSSRLQLHFHLVLASSRPLHLVLVISSSSSRPLHLVLVISSSSSSPRLSLRDLIALAFDSSRLRQHHSPRPPSIRPPQHQINSTIYASRSLLVFALAIAVISSKTNRVDLIAVDVSVAHSARLSPLDSASQRHHDGYAQSLGRPRPRPSTGSHEHKHNRRCDHLLGPSFGVHDGPERRRRLQLFSPLLCRPRLRRRLYQSLVCFRSSAPKLFMLTAQDNCRRQILLSL